MENQDILLKFHNKLQSRMESFKCTRGRLHQYQAVRRCWLDFRKTLGSLGIEPPQTLRELSLSKTDPARLKDKASVSAVSASLPLAFPPSSAQVYEAMLEAGARAVCDWRSLGGSEYLGSYNLAHQVFASMVEAHRACLETKR